MEKVMSDFGIQPVLLAAQVVNFLILLFILNRLLYKPILKILKERKEKIAQSLENAEEIEKKLAQTEEDRDLELAKATKEAQGIIDDATKSATEIIDEAHKKASSDIEKMVVKAHESIATDREKMRQELRAELADLVVIGLEKVTRKVLTGKDQQRLVTDTIKDLR